MGDTLDLRCKVTGDASARISWYKVAQDGPLPENVRIRGPVLVINGVMPENGGVYRCTVESYAGTFTDDYVLAMQGEISFFLLVPMKLVYNFITVYNICNILDDFYLHHHCMDLY